MMIRKTYAIEPGSGGIESRHEQDRVELQTRPGPRVQGSCRDGLVEMEVALHLCYLGGDSFGDIVSVLLMGRRP